MRDQHQIPRDLAGAAMLSNRDIVKKNESNNKANQKRIKQSQ